MHYRWLGEKPHHRFAMAEVNKGEVFEPTPAEIRSFGDLMEMVGASLAVSPTPVPPEGYVRTEDQPAVSGQESRRLRGKE